MVSQSIQTGCPKISIHVAPIYPYRVSQFIQTVWPELEGRGDVLGELVDPGVRGDQELLLIDGPCGEPNGLLW